LLVRLVHLADLHLGFRQYQRLTPGGINQREADVARTFESAIDRIIELAPEVVLFAGDIFHSVRPSNPAILHAFIHFSRLMQKLPQSRVVMVAGNHDTPRSAETGSILQLFSRLGIDVVEREPLRVEIPEFDLAVLCVPDAPGMLPKFEPDPRFKHNVLLFHGEVEGVIPAVGASPERAARIVTQRDLNAAAFDYCALGHYHVHRQVAENAWYSGATDYTSTHVWQELAEERAMKLGGKSFIEWHVESKTMIPRFLNASRGFIDLPPISADGLTVAELDDRIRTTVELSPEGIDDRVIRLRVHDVPAHMARELDHRLIREFKKRALNFFLDIRRPDRLRRSASGAPGKRPGLDEILKDALATRLIPGDIDRNALIDLGGRYLRQADALAATAAVPEA
jgi:DNA repair protein SbcD/Mre11